MPFSYQNPTASIEARVHDLLSRMTLAEKINQMSVRMGAGDPPEIAARLNNESQKEAIDLSPHKIPLLITRETSHGLNTAAVTSFPACIAMASTWDEDLNHRIGRAIAKESRAQGVHQGLSPVLDIARDPRWGRQEETLGDDPHLVARLGVAFIKGLQNSPLEGQAQGFSPGSEGIIACPKHLIGYGASEGGKDNDPITISERDLHEIYLPPFEAAIKEANAQSIMICFGALNGIPCTLDPTWCADIPKKWGFTGHIVDDCPGIAGLLGHRAASNIKDAIALGINAGIDRQFYDFIGEVPNQIVGQQKFEEMLAELVKEGRVPESRINEAAARVLKHKLELGLFENAIVDPAEAQKISNCDQHRALARETAVKGIVLLKNENNLLPLDPTKLKKIAVIGPNANEGQLGDYSGKPTHIVTPLEGIQAALAGAGLKPALLHAKACEILSPAMVGARFSVRLEGSLKVDADDIYTFHIESNDGFRLSLDNKTIAEDWTPGPIRTRTVTLKLTKSDHSLQLDYYRGTRFLSTDPEKNALNRNTLRLSWSTSKSDRRIIPTDNLTYRGALGTQQHGSGEGLMMNVFLGPNFEPPLPEQSRPIREIDFDWGDFSPILSDTAESHEADTIAQAVEVARDADVVLLFVGETSIRGPQQVCGEHFDRANLGLTGSQNKLIDAIAALNKPTVVTLINGRALAIPEIIEKVPAVLEAWYPGQEGGHAIADILFGKENPSGKLPVSMPHSAGQLPIYHNRRPRMGWYIDAKSEPLFPFGFGLSYTTFEYTNLKITPERGTAESTFTVSVDLTNTGPRPGEEVVQLYTEPAICSFATPTRRLTHFRRIHLTPGQTQTINFTLTPKNLATLDAHFQPRLEPGEFKIQVGPETVRASIATPHKSKSARQ
jgi:beta-glucosidase